MYSPFVETTIRFMERLTSFDLSIAMASYILVPVGAYIAFRQQSAREPLGRGLPGFFHYCFPKMLFINPSSRRDLLFTFVKHFVNAWLLVPLLLSSSLVAHFCYDLLVKGFGERAQNTPTTQQAVAMIAFAVLCQDFLTFVIHYYHHKVKLLWDVHKVHHSPEVLVISLSVKRTHLIEDAANLLPTAIMLGVLVAAMSYLFSFAIVSCEIYGVDAWFFVLLFSFWHLRHSHMSLSYGWLENIFQSPAQHQLHHSFNQEHWDKNFGMLFSFWDRMFGCFLYSVDPRSFRVGLPEADRHEYDSVIKLYWTPFRKIYQAAARSWRKRPSSAGLPARSTTESNLTAVSDEQLA